MPHTTYRYSQPLNPHAPVFTPSSPNPPTPALYSTIHPNIRLGTVNTCSWLKRSDEIKNLFSTSQLDILGVTETWLTADIPSCLLAPSADHAVIRNDRHSDNLRRGGGVAFLVHPSISHTHRPDLQPRDQTIEIVCIELHHRPTPAFVFCCYRPPWQSPAQFCDSFRTCIQSIPCPQASILVVGDFNARLSRWLTLDPDTPAGLYMSDTLDNLGLSQVVDQQATRYSPGGNTSSLLDLVITNIPFKLSHLTILPPVSDHCPVVFDFAVPKLPATPNPQSSSPCLSTRLDFAHTDWQELNDHLWKLPLLDTIRNAQTVDDAWSSWRAMLEDAVFSFVPGIRRPVFPTNKPWFAATHHRQRQCRDRLFSKAKCQGTTEVWTFYRLARNRLNSAIRKAKRHFHEKMARDLQNHRGSYSWWRKAKLLCNINRPTSAIPDLQEDNQIKPVTSSADKAALLARKFASYSQAPLSQPDLHSAISLPTSTEKFSIQPFSAQSIFDSLHRLSTYRSTAGKLCNRILKEIAEATSQTLAVLFNR
eukprot:scpid50219/ scgid21841/ 